MFQVSGRRPCRRDRRGCRTARAASWRCWRRCSYTNAFCARTSPADRRRARVRPSGPAPSAQTLILPALVLPPPSATNQTNSVHEHDNNILWTENLVFAKLFKLVAKFLWVNCSVKSLWLMLSMFLCNIVCCELWRPALQPCVHCALNHLRLATTRSRLRRRSTCYATRIDLSSESCIVNTECASAIIIRVYWSICNHHIASLFYCDYLVTCELTACLHDSRKHQQKCTITLFSLFEQFFLYF